MITLTQHAKVRQAQRGVSTDAVKMVQVYGQRHRGLGGKIIFFLGHRDVREAKELDGIDISMHVNTAVVESPDGVVLTVLKVDSPKKITGIKR
ncbi:MAG: hypothetical protein LAT68_15810 [Cyclobacteriaceae bacterium]|nr:hypothetical protein [Cyclobacteriaceae bacterium]